MGWLARRARGAGMGLGEGGPVMGLPSGTVTFVFTDLEGSTARWEAHPEQMAGALARHDAIVREAVGAHGGTVFATMGDGMAAAFPSAKEAVRAALAAQQELGVEDWGEVTGPSHYPVTAECLECGQPIRDERWLLSQWRHPGPVPRPR